jgi:WD40 repeat protein
LASVDKSEIIVWSAKKRTEVSRITLPEGYTTKELTVSPGGRYAAASSSNGEVRLWDTSSIDHAGTPLQFKGEKSMIFSPDGKWLITGCHNEIMLWNINVGKFDPRRIPAPADEFSMKFGPDSSLLAIRDNKYVFEILVGISAILYPEEP